MLTHEYFSNSYTLTQWKIRINENSGTPTQCPAATIIYPNLIQIRLYDLNIEYTFLHLRTNMSTPQLPPH